MTDTPLTRREAIRLFRWIALYVPVAILLVLAVIQAILLPDLGATIATHFGLGGTANGFGPAWTYPLMTALCGGGVTALIAGLALAGARGGSRSTLSPLLAAVIWWEVGFLGLGMTGAVLAQTDLSAGTVNVGWWLLAGFAIGAVAGILAWRLTPRIPVEGRPPEGAPPPAVELAPQERAVWMRTVAMGRTGLIVLAVALVLMGASMVASIVSEMSERGSPGAASWITIAVSVLVIAVVLMNVVFTVRVDDDGLCVRSVIGFPRIRIARRDIRSVEVVQINPMGEYGGWGWRIVPGNGSGIVLRAGEGLRVIRADGRPFAVTVDDAETAAALLGGMKEREAGA